MYAVEAKNMQGFKSDGTWSIIMLTEARDSAYRYTKDHNGDGGIPLRAVKVSITAKDAADLLPYKVQLGPEGSDVFWFRYEPEAIAYKGRHLNASVTPRP